MSTKICRILYAAIATLLVLKTTNGVGQTTPKPLPLDPSVKTGKLSNGFTYYIRHNEEPKNRVILYLANKVGSILEEDDQQGLAHFMEHMNFNGTKHFPKNELVNYLQKAGIRFGADINAYTGFDETVYQLPLPANQPLVLSNGLQIMRDWAQEAILDPVEIDKERGVILEEERLSQGVSERMRRKYFPILLNNSRYASRIPIGKESIIKNFKPETIKRFYKDWYRPNLQALIIVGDIDVAQMEKKVKALFGDLKNPVKSRVRPHYSVPLTGKNQFIALTDPEMTTTTAEVIIKHKAPLLKTTRDYRNSILTLLYNQMMGNRFNELSRQADVPFIQGSAGIGEFMGGLNSFTASVTAEPGKLEKGFKALWTSILRVKKFGFTNSELMRAKKAFQNQMASAVKEKDKTNSNAFVNDYLQYFLNEKAAPGILKEFELINIQLPGITLEEVNRVTSNYITATNRDVVIMAPEKEKTNLPTEATVNQWMLSVEQGKIQPYQDEQSQADLLTSIPLPGKIIAKKYDAETQTTLYTLSNGAKVLLKPTNFRNNEIQFNAFSPGGTSLYSDDDYQSAANAAGIIASCGIGSYNANQFSKFINGKQYGVQPYIAERFEGLSGWSSKEELPEAMKLLHAYFTLPRKDEEVFKNIAQRSKAGLKNRLNDPNSVFSDTIDAVLSQNSIRRTGPTEEKLDHIDLNRSFEIYKERFADASDFTFVFTGSIDTTSIKPLLEQYLASLPATHQEEKAKNLGIRTPEGQLTKTVYMGEENKATVRLVFSGTSTYSILNQIQLNAVKEVLQLRLIERLREEEAGVYSPSVQASFVQQPENRYSLVVSFGCAPANAEKLIASTMDEIAKLRKSGPVQANVNKFLAEERLQQETALKSNDFWISYLSEQLQNNDPVNEILSYQQELKKVSTESVKNAAKRYLDGKNLIRFLLLPRK